MFTGLVEALGKVTALNRSGRDWQLSIHCPELSQGLKEGDSIAVSGVCLTVIQGSSTTFVVEVSEETVQRTTFTTLTPGQAVNLEPSLGVNGRLHGHLVQGHVDAVGKVESITQVGRSTRITFTIPANLGKYVVAKGSVAVEGVSLTVNEVQDAGNQTRFSVNLIPHTLRMTTLQHLRPGSRVNVETDVIGRYVERLLGKSGPVIDENYLKEMGFS